MKEKIIEKIKKALALANNNKNPNEAQAAMLMAQKMMAKYHIEMQEIEESEESEIQENELDIKLSHSTITLTNLNQISLIQSYDIPSSQTEEEREKQFLKDVEKLKNILSEINDDNSNNMMATIRDIETIEDIFIF